MCSCWLKDHEKDVIKLVVLQFISHTEFTGLGIYFGKIVFKMLFVPTNFLGPLILEFDVKS
jgi:hypothetical protein